MIGRLCRAVFLDRDGVLNELVQREGAAGSPRRLADFRVAPGAAEAVRRLRARGLRVFVVSNQPDVARGRLDPSELAAMSTALRETVEVDEVVVCPHDDSDDCGCRKPKTGMLDGLARRWGVELPTSFLVGDSWRDIEAGARAGCRTILVGGVPPDRCRPDRVAPTFAAAVATIEEELDHSNR